MSRKWESRAYAFYHPAEIGTGKDGSHVHALLTLTEKLDEEELTTLDENDNDKEPENDNLEGWIDEFETLMPEKQNKLNMDVLPVCHVLVKVRDEYTPLIDV